MQGFLPQKVPSKSYSVQSESCDRIQEIASNLPKLLLTGKLQSAINKLSPKDLSIDDLLINQASQDKARYVTFKFYCSCLYLG